MSFEKWLELQDEIVSESSLELVDELYTKYVYEMRANETRFVWANLL